MPAPRIIIKNKKGSIWKRKHAWMLTVFKVFVWVYKHPQINLITKVFWMVCWNHMCLCRGSGPEEVFYKRGALESFEKFTEKHLCRNLSVNKVESCRLTLFMVRNHPFGTWAKFSEKLSFFTPWYAQACAYIMG